MDERGGPGLLTAGGGLPFGPFPWLSLEAKGCGEVGALALTVMGYNQVLGWLSLPR